MDSLDAARQLIGHTLAFHIVIVALSIGLPVLMSIFEWRAWRKNDDKMRATVKLLARWAMVFVIGGIFTGTAVALQMSTLWAPFLNEVRPNVGIFFQLEGYMFLIEAVFLSWYFMTMHKVGTRKHFWIGIPVSIGTIGSAFFITTVNAYMNNPSGQFTITTWLEFSHSLFSYIFATFVLYLGYVAWRSLHKHPKAIQEFLHFKMGKLAIYTAVLLVILALLGHQSAVNLATTQPNKLAAIEILDTTQSNAPLRIGGEINAKGEAEGGIVLPGMLSVLVGYNNDTVVKGLNEIPRDQWPQLVVHLLFDIKMALIALVSGVVILVIFFIWRKKQLPKWLRVILIPVGLVGFVLVELGWFITEFGRQTWTVVGRQTTADALIHGADIKGSLIIFIMLFIILSLSTLFALAYTTRHWRATEKLSW
ncbi:MAG: cytochrome ubiquinol oxidase subunit I [Candidatus Saccharimonas sp.]